MGKAIKVPWRNAASGVRRLADRARPGSAGGRGADTAGRGSSHGPDGPTPLRFYAATFPDSAVRAVHRAPGDVPSGRAGDVLTVEFTVLGVPCLGLNGGPAFPRTEAFSFQVATDDHAETDRDWDGLVGSGGAESACGWCKDRWGVSWQITPRTLTEALAAGGDEARRAFEAMMTMHRIDVAAIESARQG